MSQKNLSETLFKPHARHQETSTLVRRVRHNTKPAMNSTLDGQNVPHWYRLINRLMWIWRGVDPREIIEVQARIATSQAERTNAELFDTVVGYRGGNWIYEWSTQAMSWQQRASETEGIPSGQSWLRAANLYSIAAYPHLRGDELAEQAQVLANHAYEEAASRLGGGLKELVFKIPGGPDISGFLHLPAQGEGPFPVVLVCGGLDALQSDYYTLFERYFAPHGMAMLTVDMPSVGASVKWKLTQDTSLLHQQILKQLPDIPYIDHTRVAVFGFRFGANVAVRLAYLEPARLRAVACLGPIVHSLLSDIRRQNQVPEMYMDVLASRMGMDNVSDNILQVELNRFSLKTQGLLGHRCPTPMLAGYWDDDPFSPPEDARLIASSSTDGKLLTIPFSPVYHSFNRALLEITRWIDKCME